MTAPLPWEAHLPAGLRREEVDLLGARTLVGSWLRQWAEEPDRPVLHDDEAGWLTAAALEARSGEVAAAAAGIGLGHGDRVLVSASPSTELATAFVGLLRLGLTVAPLNPALSAREVRHVVADATPRAAFLEDAGLALHVQAAAAALGRGVAVHSLGRLTSARNHPDPARLDLLAPDDPALLVYTSGTTGKPKGAPLTQANLLASAEALRIAWRWEGSDRLVLSLPLFHVHGLGVGLFGSLTCGASVLVRPGFSPGDVLESARSHAASLFFGVPTMYARLAASGRIGELAPLRLAVSGSAPLPAKLFAAVRDGSGQAVLERYGMSETLMLSSNPYEGERRPGTVGFPLPGVEAQIDDATGEILVRGPNVFPGYLGLPDSTRGSLARGWFRTGDAGEVDDAGYLRIVGRLRELIISGGFNVYPREVEDVLRSHPGVVDAAVVGIPSDEWGEEVVAYVEGDASPDALGRLAAAELAPYKRPKAFRFVASLPRNALGKVLRSELEEDSGLASRGSGSP